MTDEERAERDRLLAERASLINQIDRALAQNANLQAELATLIQNVNILADNAATMGAEVVDSMEYVKNRVKDTDVSTSELFALIDDLTSSYFVFKNMSTASKNVSQFTDEYYRRFQFFNELRRISLGYVIGLDAHICSDETMRKRVEEAYLQNTEYWLAYSIMAVMLWANDEEDAAKRAMSKSLAMDYFSTSLFFLLINLRFTRVDVAKKWYLSYLDRVDVLHLGDEWQYLLQAYLSGVFGADKEFNKLVYTNFKNMLDQMESMRPNYGNRVIDKTLTFSNAYIHITKNEFETLRRNSPDYEELKDLLSDAEKNEVLAIHFRKIVEDNSSLESDIYQRIENILYDLVNSYEKEELKVVRNKRYNEMIIRARGDLAKAQEYFNYEFDDNTSTSLDDLLFSWAFEEDPNRVDITVKKFSISYLKKWISKGFQAFANEYRKKEPEKIHIEIDGWQGECDENSFEKSQEELQKHYNKNRLWDVLQDKYVKIFLALAVAALVLLVITVFKFNKISLVMGILLGVVSGFLLWRRIADLQTIFRLKQEKGYKLLKKALEELKVWREMFKEADKKNEDLVNVFEDIEV